MTPDGNLVYDPTDAEFRQFHENNPGLAIFQTRPMFQVYRRTKGCRPHAFGLLDPHGGLGGILVSVVFHDAPGVSHASVRGGPVCGKELETALPSLLEAHERQLAWTTLYTRIYPLDIDEPVHLVAPKMGFQRTAWLNYLVGIENLDSTWQALAKERRKGIRKGDDAGLAIREVESDSDIETLHRLLRVTARRNRIPMQHRSLLYAVRDILSRNRLARLVLAVSGGEAIAGRVVLESGDRLYDWFAGSLARGNALHANEWLVWQLMDWGHERGLRWFDFGGAGNPIKPYGPREFKRRFNGAEVELGRYTRRHYPRLARVAEDVRVLIGGEVEE